VIEELYERIASDPRNFFSITQSALMPSDLEEVDGQLIKFINLHWTIILIFPRYSVD